MDIKYLQAQLLLSSLAYNRCKYHLNDMRMMFNLLDHQTSADDQIIRHLISLTKNIANELELNHQGTNCYVSADLHSPCNDNALSHYSHK